MPRPPSSTVSTRLPVIQAGTCVGWRGRTYRVEARDGVDALLLHVTDLDSLQPERLSLLDLLLAPGEGQAAPLFAPNQETLRRELERRLPPPAPTTSIHLAEDSLVQADRILETVEGVQHLLDEQARLAKLEGKPFARTPAIRAACAQLAQPIALPTYYRYRRLYRHCAGDRNRLVAGLHRQTFHQTRMNPAQLHLCDTLILRYYARATPLSAKIVYALLREVLAHTGGYWLDPSQCVGPLPQHIIEELLNAKLPIQTLLDQPEKAKLLSVTRVPSRSWFYQYLNYFKALPDQGQAIISARYGKEVWESEHLVFDVFVTRATLPLQYVFADHWLCDVFVVDEATRQTLQRLWLTVLIDAYSRSVLGMALLHEPPSTESILTALQHAIWPKTSHTELGFTEPWICYGIPAQLFLDNAWAHLSGSLENLARVIGHQGRYATIDLDFRPPYRGRYGGLIERLFGNLSGQVKQFLPGAIQSSQPRQVQNAAKQACLVYQDLDRFCQRAIVTYQHTPHRELGGMTPHQKWLEGLQATWPLVPPLTEALRRQFWRLYPETRQITQKGVSLFGMHYWSPELNQAQRVQLNGQPVRYGVHYDPADIRRIALFRDDEWVGDVWAKELRLPDGSYRSLSLWEQSLAKEIAGDHQRVAQDWKAYLDELDELSQQRWIERAKARRTAKRSAALAVPAPNAAEIERATEELTPETADSAMTALLAGFAQGGA